MRSVPGQRAEGHGLEPGPEPGGQSDCSGRLGPPESLFSPTGRGFPGGCSPRPAPEREDRAEGPHQSQAARTGGGAGGPGSTVSLAHRSRPPAGGGRGDISKGGRRWLWLPMPFAEGSPGAHLLNKEKPPPARPRRLDKHGQGGRGPRCRPLLGH